MEWPGVAKYQMKSILLNTIIAMAKKERMRVVLASAMRMVMSRTAREIGE